MTSLHIDPGGDGEPITIEGLSVLPEWIDYNGHMNVAYYLRAFDLAVDKIFELIGLTERYRSESGYSCFALECHITYRKELREGDPLRVSGQFLNFDGKRLHSIYRMYHAGEDYLASTAEWLQMSIDMHACRSAPFQEPVAERIAAILAQHSGLPRPPEVGRVMGVKRRA
ncbi:MAG: thioesterase family protein [Rhodospirillales bacterium]|nr:thioesterase family protein [Rhodospirillales bacterium]